MEEQNKLTNAEYRLMDILWEAAPVASPALCKLCEQQLGWKRTTTYTVLKRLCERGIAQNENTIVTALLGREEAQAYESRAVVEKAFGGSLPAFITAFLGSGKISGEEAGEIQRLIDSYRKELDA